MKVIVLYRIMHHPNAAALRASELSQDRAKNAVAAKARRQLHATHRDMHGMLPIVLLTPGVRHEPDALRPRLSPPSHAAAPLACLLRRRRDRARRVEHHGLLTPPPCGHEGEVGPSSGAVNSA
jgi:hypothetical protein